MLTSRNICLLSALTNWMKGTQCFKGPSNSLKAVHQLHPSTTKASAIKQPYPLHCFQKAMEKLVDDGLTKSIGISNFNSRQIEHILTHCRIRPVNLQIECNANFPNEKLVCYAQSKGLTVSAYAPLGSPRDHAYTKNDLLNEPWVKNIAEKHKRTAAQVLLRYLVQRNIIVIPKSTIPSQMAENTKIFDFKLSSKEMKVLHTSGSNKRQFTNDNLRNHPEYPFNSDY